MTPEQVNETMRRCPPEAIEAALKFQTSKDASLVPAIVLGIIERYVEPQNREKVRTANDDTRLFDELGVDSLMMVEIVMTVEDILQISAPDEELRTLRTLGDVKKYLDAKTRGIPYVPNLPPLILTREQIADALPQQDPFLFVQTARISGDTITGTYAISGEEPALKGHFKDGPVLPASIMIEAIGQLASLYILRSGKPEFATAKAEGKAWFASADTIRCQRICRPGDTLSLEVILLRLHAPIATFSGTITVNGQKTASVGEMTLAFGAIVPASPAAEPPPAATGTAPCEA
jgi:acyl carrier protein